MQRFLMLIMYDSKNFQRNFFAKEIIHHSAAANHKQPCLLERSEKRRSWNFERKKQKKIPNGITALISEEFTESLSDEYPLDQANIF